jgi:hypothetical protein
MPRPEVPLSTIARQVDLGFNRKERKRSKQPFRNRVQYHDIFQVSYVKEDGKLRLTIHMMTVKNEEDKQS